jgi:hypothetical protein
MQNYRVESKGEEFTFGRRSIILCLIGACIVIGFVSQAQNSQKEEASPLYEFRAAQAAETFGLAPSGSANSDLEFGSIATADLKVLLRPSPNGYTLFRAATGKGCYGTPIAQTSWNCKPTSSGCTYSVPGCRDQPDTSGPGCPPTGMPGC